MPETSTDELSALSTIVDDAIDASLANDNLAIPACPAAFLAMQRLVAKDDFGLDDLAKVIEPDQALAAAVLKYANSALYGGREPTTTLKAGIGRIGVRELISVALVMALGDQARSKGPLGGVRRIIFQQSVVSGILCRDLAEHFKVNSNEAYLCGLLHDFGRLVAVTAIEAALTERNLKSPLAEKGWMHLIDGRHIELGRVLAAKWGLPDPVVRSMTDHHVSSSDPMVQLVSFSDQIIKEMAEKPSVSDCEIVKIGAVSDDKFMKDASRVMLSLPATLSELLEDLRDPEPKPAPSTWVKSTTDLGPQAHAVQVGLKVMRGKRELLAMMTAISPQILRMVVDEPLDENFMTRLLFASGGTEHAVFGNVAACRTEAGKFVVDVKPFGMSDAQKSVWFDFWRAGGGAKA